MGVVIKVILFIVVIWFIIRTISRGIFSLLFGSSAAGINERARRQQEETLHRKKYKKEGDVTINYQPKSDKNFGKDDGDYIDFEEVK